MGQASSQPERRRTADESARSSSVLRRALQPRSLGRSHDGLQDGLLNGEPRRHGSTRLSVAGNSSGSNNSGTNAISNSRRRLSQLLRASDREAERPQVQLESDAAHGSALLHRTRSRFQEMLRRDSVSTSRPSFLHHRSSYVRSAQNSQQDDFFPPPRLPSIDLSSNFDHDSLAQHSDSEPVPRTEASHRRHSMRLNALRPDRPFRHLTSSLRRRRSPHPSMSSFGSRAVDDQAAMLSRLLSVAAAHTAATLMGVDHDYTEARSLNGTGLGDLIGGTGGSSSSGGGGGSSGSNGGAAEDGSFDGFLRALENGRIASALRQGATDSDAGEPGHGPPLNFFRMFRFGATSASGSGSLTSQAANASPESETNPEGRMVPIIIVGIRSITPGSNNGSVTDELPSFIDALGNFSAPLANQTTHTHDSIDSILRPPQNGTSFRHRRRASMGAFGMGRNRLNDRMDDQRDHRSPDRRRERPWSVASSSSAFDPRPPPATPASPSPELSRIPSRNSTPAHSRPASVAANSTRELGSESRRNSTLHRASTASPLSAHTEEAASIHSAHSATNLLEDGDRYRIHRRAEPAANVHYPRFASGHPRRNGVVEPDHLPSLSRSSTSNATDSSTNHADQRNGGGDARSWIIYVLGGSYPEHHPILTTPSLFSENPTYEDMVLLSALLGPAKAPVATEEDVQNAGGVYQIVEDQSAADSAKTAQLVAAAAEGDDRVFLEPGQRCLVCLCDFEAKEMARKLAKCKHLFHKECIDQWLTTGRNSCPLCREQGVDEKPADAAAAAVAAADSAPEHAAAESSSVPAVAAAAGTHAGERQPADAVAS